MVALTAVPTILFDFPVALIEARELLLRRRGAAVTFSSTRRDGAREARRGRINGCLLFDEFSPELRRNSGSMTTYVAGHGRAA